MAARGVQWQCQTLAVCFWEFQLSILLRHDCKQSQTRADEAMQSKDVRASSLRKTLDFVRLETIGKVSWKLLKTRYGLVWFAITVLGILLIALISSYPDFYLFSPMKEALRGIKFTGYEVVKKQSRKINLEFMVKNSALWR